MTQRMTLGELRTITNTVVRNRAQHYADPATAAEVAARVTRYILGLTDRFAPVEASAVAHQYEVVMDVLEQVLQDMEQECRQDDL